MSGVRHAVVGLAVVAFVAAGCATGAPLSSSTESSSTEPSSTGPSSTGPSSTESSRAPVPSTSASAAREAILWPETCDDLVGSELATELDSRGLVEGPTDDTIQGRFTGIGNSDRFAESLSCAYSAVDGREDRFEFGVEQLSADDHAALIELLRSGQGENTTGLTERADGDTLFFTQVGAAASGSVPGDWAMAFAVYPDAWTMVWSPAGGPDALAQHLLWSGSLEEQLYPGS